LCRFAVNTLSIALLLSQLLYVLLLNAADTTIAMFAIITTTKTVGAADAPGSAESVHYLMLPTVNTALLNRQAEQDMAAMQVTVNFVTSHYVAATMLTLSQETDAISN
jgi:hypothetical protein